MGIFEFAMLLCFGFSWPFAIAKTYRTKNVAGKSPLFMIIVIIGYVFGMLHKIFFSFNWVFWAYIIDTALVATDLILYCKYRSLGSVPSLAEGGKRRAEGGRQKAESEGRRDEGTGPLVLASGSPRRKRLMTEAGYSFEVVTADATEIMGRDPVATVSSNARAKLEAVRPLRPNSPILAADTLVWFNNHLVGKPHDLAEAAEFLRSFSGNTQTVYTAVAFSSPQAPVEIRVEASTVKFRTLSDADIHSYLKLVNPLDRAGAYDISDYGDIVVESISGSRTNVIGLPMDTVKALVG